MGIWCSLFLLQVAPRAPTPQVYTNRQSIYVYLEYGLAWPFSGGEYVYVCLGLVHSFELC